MCIDYTVYITQTCNSCTATIQAICAWQVTNWKILLRPFFTAHIFCCWQLAHTGKIEYTRVFLNSITDIISIPGLAASCKIKIHKKLTCHWLTINEFLQQRQGTNSYKLGNKGSADIDRHVNTLCQLKKSYVTFRLHELTFTTDR